MRPSAKFLPILSSTMALLVNGCADPAPTLAVPATGQGSRANADTRLVNAPLAPMVNDSESTDSATEQPATVESPSNSSEGSPELTLNDSAQQSPVASGDDSGNDSVTSPSEDEIPPVAEALPFLGDFILGADISGVPETIANGAVFIDTDGEQKSILALLKNHGFNYIRLRTFVEPLAQYGYGSGDGAGCQTKTEAFNDLEHVVAFAQQAKAAGFGYLLDLHYSDTWADPGKQVIPEAWRDVTSIEQLAERVSDYTTEVVQAMVDAGARPDMVQVGNETTPGMLIHVPTANTDCYGNNSNQNPEINGRANNWNNLGRLLRAGADAVRQVDESIQIMLHIENTDNLNGVRNWVQEAQAQNVDFDVLGLSAYETFQGPANAWQGTLQSLVTSFPGLDFAIAEYNPQRRLLNDIMRELPNGQGLGTFFWEPTRNGSWGDAMFDRQGNTFSARAEDFAEYDQMRLDYDLP